MTAAPAETVLKFVEGAKLYAALSGRFDPKQALPTEAKGDPKLLVEIASALAAGCDTNPDESSEWLLRSSERRYILGSLRAQGRLSEAIAERRSSAPDQEAEELLLALEGGGPFSPDAIRHELEQPASEQRVERIERIVVALDRAGQVAPAAELLDAARAALASLRRDERRRTLRRRGFFGRDAEKARLAAWFGQDQLHPPVRCAFLTGLPGVGKSALLEEMVSLAHGEAPAITVRLDFDRAGLGVLDLQGLTMEVARQVAERVGAYGKDLLAARLAAASVSVDEESALAARQSIFPERLAQAVGKAVRQWGRPVTLVLDTVEVLRARGERHPPALFDWIDKMVAAGLAPVHVIAAGRGDALDTCAARVGERIELRGLDEHACAQLLEQLNVPKTEWAGIQAIADGNPLVIRLATDVVRNFGAANLPRRKLDRKVSAAFLYRFLLSRIEDPLLRRLAHPGLVVRRVNAALLGEVIAPSLGIELSPGRALQIFEELASQHWLVTRDPLDPEFVIHRSDMRLVLLELLYRDEPALCASINRAAVAWFGRRPDAASALDAAYHRLQLMRTRAAAPLIDNAVLQQFDQQLIAELPAAAQHLVAQGQGGRSSLFRGGDGIGSSEDFVRELMNLLERQDWAEGQYVVDQGVAAGGFDARSEAADAVRAFWWGAGRWAEARRLLAERDRLGAGDSDLDNLPPLLARARLEMRAELDRRRLARAMRSFGRERMQMDLQPPDRSLSRDGALAFWAAANLAQPLMREERRKDVSPVDAAMSLWTNRDSYWKEAVETARSRLLSRSAGPLSLDEQSAPQLLATGTPYLAAALSLATQSRYDWLARSAADADRQVSAAGAFISDQPLQPLPSNPIAGLAGLGVLAEWLDAAGFLRRDANVRAIGRCAERWRRTVAGEWQYGRRPAGWRWTDPIDQSVGRRLLKIDSGGGAVAQAMALLEPWSPDNDADKLLRILEGRLSSVLRAASAEKSAEHCAAVLQRWNVPAAFVPPLAILVVRRAIKLGESR